MQCVQSKVGVHFIHKRYWAHPAPPLGVAEINVQFRSALHEATLTFLVVQIVHFWN